MGSSPAHILMEGEWLVYFLSFILSSTLAYRMVPSILKVGFPTSNKPLNRPSQPHQQACLHGDLIPVHNEDGLFGFFIIIIIGMVVHLYV